MGQKGNLTELDRFMQELSDERQEMVKKIEQDKQDAKERIKQIIEKAMMKNIRRRK